jgi:EAL domain-containing protein (putative c-di-GMP-specific phosphodiesterase class I)
MITNELAVEQKLRHALANGEFVLHYQPKVDLQMRRVTGVEALIRWQSPALGLVPPIRFIPLMEETGLIVETGLWVLRQAINDRARWFNHGISAPRVAINVSTVQLRRHDFVENMTRILGSGGSGDGIDFEITESAIINDVACNMGKLKAMRDLGVGIALDDFGTGYSSLSYLAKLPVELLKIDRSFIAVMLEDSAVMTLVSTMITMAHALHLTVIAEGVESEEQARILRLLHCDQMQGYLVSKPLTFDDMAEFLLQETAVMSVAS